ncbi:MAG: SulP family inorganic anion transporter [Lentisphaeraceae bacterium]|nr:SulP family inorganic anion transporter [Lentisphaeraceae bacterium]
MFQLFIQKPHNLKDDVLSGLTVSLALVPEAVAFAFVAGVDPLVGLYAAFFVGLITSIFGGRPGMISGATGAMAVVMTGFVVLYGIQYLFAAVIAAGLIQVLAGVFRLGKFIRLLPHPVMLGFVNGLAIVIGLAQFGQFKDNKKIVFNDSSMSFSITGDWLSFSNPKLWVIAGIILLTMAIIHFLPKLTRAIPAPLVAIVVCTVLCATVPALKSKTVADVVNSERLLAAEKQQKTAMFEKVKDTLTLNQVATTGNEIAASEIVVNTDEIKTGLKAGLPQFSIPSITWDFHSIKVIFLLGLTLASIGLIESLMTLTLIDEITETRGQGNRECIGQGAANIVTGFFGGMGGCAMIGQSMININSGGRGRTSGISAALFLFGFILFAPGLIEVIPIASLIGVMFMVVIATFEWASLRLFGKVPKSDILVVIVVSAVTVVLDLAIAVGIGIIISALVYAWNSAKQLHLKLVADKTGERTYEVQGNVFFGSITSFKELFNPSEDPDVVILDFKNSKVCDHSGIEAVHGLSEKYKSLKKTLHLKHLSPECSILLKKAGDLVDINMMEDPKYHIAEDTLA